MTEHAPKPNETIREKLGHPKEILRNMRLRHISNIAGYHFPQDGSFLDDLGNKATVSKRVNAKRIEVIHTSGRQTSHSQITVSWDETHGDMMLPGVEATCQRYRDEEEDGIPEFYSSSDDPSNNTLRLGDIVNELRFAKRLHAQATRPTITLQAPVDTTGV